MISSKKEQLEIKSLKLQIEWMQRQIVLHDLRINNSNNKDEYNKLLKDFKKR